MPDEMNMLYLLVALAFGYLLGSIPFGVIFTRMAGLGDIRKVGSGNIGATNVLRTGRKGLAAATLLGDALKGTAAVLLAARWGDQFATLAALGAFLGHLYPLWLKFKGGKGVATFIGVLIGLNWIAALIFAAIWLGVAFASRYSSLSALAASAATPVALWLLNAPEMAAMAVILVALLWWKHSENISRLLDGTEGKIGQKG
ncbi:glycerol-3-phosphate 1-O-acyltransferase PlsY [Microvirga makkahensis]|uniref:Glycerol-3-phosphate acyltransferase n=1 Tax=Microvirga makkahensis TaxID=1128670 RepID=A0A7X3MQ05_9HYPH|nr:glycerol-3-phosphate 1-O-acyltransferase PlsY [Microvirga makkahensis]MXQ11063.1 glycerol-3-phosphate 1-O-acyltransferase PlsY [Microvirga makkahensis]